MPNMHDEPDLNISRFDLPALEMTRLEAFTMVAMHAILLGEGGGLLTPEEVGENAAAMAEASLSSASDTLAEDTSKT
jgi:hypothetical protein